MRSMLKSLNCEACSAGELVPESVNGEDVLRVPGIGLDFLPQPGDVHVDGPRGRHRVVSPDLVEKFFTRERRTAVLDEVAEELELARGQLERLPQPC